MATQRVERAGFSDTGPSSSSSSHHGFSFTSFPSNLHHSTISFSNVGGSAFDFGGLEEAIVFQGMSAADALFTEEPCATLEIFPSSPSRCQMTTAAAGSSNSREESGYSESAMNANLEPDSPMSMKETASDPHAFDSQWEPPPPHQLQQQQHSYDKRKGAEGHGDAKTLKRLAQNREAARKSRLRKKAYVQQLESSRMKLTQLEQDLQRARSQGVFVGSGGGGGGGGCGSMTTGAAVFDMEYGKWLEEDRRQMMELQTGLQAQLQDGELRVLVDGYVSHYDDMFRLKGLTAKTDVFHLITGVWTSPAERCFLWMGGFRPSDLIKMLITHLDPLTEQQLVGIYSLQQSTQQAEEALSLGLDQLQHSLIDTISNGCIADAYEHMNLALAKLVNLEGFVRQADNLRQQMLHQLRRVLTIRQAARCFIAIGEYHGRLRALSSLWASRPHESLPREDDYCQQMGEMDAMPSSSHVLGESQGFI